VGATVNQEMAAGVKRSHGAQCRADQAKSFRRCSSGENDVEGYRPSREQRGDTKLDTIHKIRREFSTTR